MIYVITHKKINIKLKDNYRILLVGANNNNNFKNNYLLDNDGINISEKNNSYCELTGLYWMWKNSKEKVIGLVHYRRFFVKIKPHFDFIGRHIVLNKKKCFELIDDKDINRILSKYDLIVRKSETRIKNNKNVFRELGDEILDYLDVLFSTDYKDYEKTYKMVKRGHYHFNGNMFVGKKEVIDKYCEWLFPLLEKIDQNHKNNTGSYYNKREIGYIPEFLFRVWVENNKINYCTIPVICTEDNDAPGALMDIKDFIRFVYSRIKRLFK